MAATPELLNPILTSIALKISPLHAMLLNIYPSKLSEQLGLIELIRETLLPSNPDGSPASAEQIKNEEERLIAEEMNRRDSNSRQYYSNLSVFKAMLLFCWSIRRGSDTFNEERLNKYVHVKESNSSRDFQAWSNVYNNFRNRLKGAVMSAILTKKKQHQHKDNILKDITVTDGITIAKKSSVSKKAKKSKLASPSVDSSAPLSTEALADIAAAEVFGTGTPSSTASMASVNTSGHTSQDSTPTVSEGSHGERKRRLMAYLDGDDDSIRDESDSDDDVEVIEAPVKTSIRPLVVQCVSLEELPLCDCK